MVIAIDYDGTITEDVPRPLIAPIREEAIKYIQLLSAYNITLVLWTSRKGMDYINCLKTLKKYGIYKYFDFTYHVCGETGKLVADYYIDDRACIDFNWSTTIEYILDKLEEN